MSHILEVKNLKKADILQGISFAVEEGEMVAIMGPSGSGKSTLLYNVSGMDNPDSGEVTLKDTQMVHLSEDEKADIRLHRIGFVFQQMNVLQTLNIFENIMLPVKHAIKSKNERKEYEKRARVYMSDLGIEDLADRKVSEVSGGQLQRACICRSLIMNPEIIFADEPTGALNQRSTKEVMEAFLDINKKGTSILLVTHDSGVASRCDRILYIIDGELKGELTLGKWEKDDASREKRVAGWLEDLGW